jgi:putative spermidine/putrescine transport system permease protein
VSTVETAPAVAGAAPRGGGRRRAPRSLLLLIPVVAFVAVFFGYPLAHVAGLSVSDFIAPQKAGLDNYSWFFGTDVNVRILVRTLTTAGLVTLICLLAGYPFAYLMTVVGTRWRIVLLAVVLVPFWTSLMVRNYAWLILLQDGGVVNDALEWIGLGRTDLIGNVKGVVIGMSQVLLPFMVLPLYASLSAIDRRFLLAAEGLGAHPALAFARVYLPLSLPGVLAGTLMVFVLSLGFYITPALLGSPQNSLLSQHIVTQINSLLAWGRGGAMAIVLLAVTLVLLAVAARVTARTRTTVETGGDA